MRNAPLFCIHDSKEGWTLRNLTFNEVRAILAARLRRLDTDLLFWTESWTHWKELQDPDCHSFSEPRYEDQKPPVIPLTPVIDYKAKPTLRPNGQYTTPRSTPVAPKVPPPVRKNSGDVPETVAQLRRPVAPVALESLVRSKAAEPSVSVSPYLKTPAQPKVPPPGSFERTEVTSSPVTDPNDNRKYHRFPVEIPAVIQTTTDQFSSWTVDISEGGIRLKDEIPEKFAGYSQIVLLPRNRTPIHLLGSLVEDQKDGRHHVEFVDSDNQAEFIAWMREQDWAQAS